MWDICSANYKRMFRDARAGGFKSAVLTAVKSRIRSAFHTFSDDEEPRSLVCVQRHDSTHTHSSARMRQLRRAHDVVCLLSVTWLPDARVTVAQSDGSIRSRTTSGLKSGKTSALVCISSAGRARSGRVSSASGTSVTSCCSSPWTLMRHTASFFTVLHYYSVFLEFIWQCLHLHARYCERSCPSPNTRKESKDRGLRIFISQFWL